MNTRVPRIISVPLLGALVATALVAAPAHAVTTIYNAATLKAAFQNGGDFKLIQDFIVDSTGSGSDDPIVASTHDITLDLNGHHLRLEGMPALEIPDGAHVTLTDGVGSGTFTAIGFSRNDPAIGAKENAAGAGALTIDGADVTAAMILGVGQTQNSATVGGGRNAEGLDLTVSAGSLKATTAPISNGPAIGSGGNGSGGTVNISGGTVTATGSDNGAGIGGGLYGDGQQVEISGGTVVAQGGEKAAGIGGGHLGHGNQVTITGGTVKVTGGDSAAGIGGGYLSNGGDVHVSGGSLDIKGGENASTIGAGARSPVTEPTTEAQRGELKITAASGLGHPPRARGPHGAKVVVDTSSTVPFTMLNTTESGKGRTQIEFGYTVTFNAVGGTPNPGFQYVMPGNTVPEPPAPTRADSHFLGWYQGSTPFDFGTVVTENLFIKAKWQPYSYDVKFNTNGGSFVSTQRVDHGDTADKPATPARLGYKFVAWQSGGSNYSFGSPVTGPLTLTATWKQNAVIPFIDVSSNTGSVYYSQFHKEINWLASAGISKGWNVGGGKYEYRPYDEITREAMAAFMYRFAGSPAVSLPSKSPFSDVTPKNTNFYKEIVWMNQQGISTGWHMSNGKQEFRPKDEITRDAMAAFMYRFAGKPATTPPAKSPFTDLPKSSQFYKEVTWLANTGISKGWTMGGGKFEYRPYDEITRDAMAAFMFRFDKI